jgi:flotillin
MQKFPEIARAIAKPLSTDLLAKMPETVGALTGVDINQMLRRLAQGDKAMKKDISSSENNESSIG